MNEAVISDTLVIFHGQAANAMTARISAPLQSGTMLDGWT